MKDKLILTKKRKIETDYRSISVGMKADLVDNLDYLAKSSNRSRSEIVNILLNYAVDKCEMENLL